MSDGPDAPVVVCVDDEPAILASLRRLLRNEPYRLMTTGKPEEAVTWVLENRARVVIADQRMPGMTGLELLELVRNCSPSTARIMLSGQTDLSGILQRTKLEAIDRLVRKPWDADELKQTLRTLVSRA
jgi:DNA-binding NtrC family response regulator